MKHERENSVNPESKNAIVSLCYKMGHSKNIFLNIKDYAKPASMSLCSEGDTNMNINNAKNKSSFLWHLKVGEK